MPVPQRPLNREYYQQQSDAADRWNRGVAIIGGVVATAALVGGAYGYHKYEQHKAEAHRPIGDVHEQHITVDPSAMLSEQLRGKPAAETMAKTMQAAMGQRAEAIAARMLHDHADPDAVPKGRGTDVQYDRDPNSGKATSITLAEYATDQSAYFRQQVTFGMEGDHIDQGDIQQVRTLRGNHEGDDDSVTVQTLAFNGKTWQYNGNPAQQGIYATDAYAFSSASSLSATSIPNLAVMQGQLQTNLDTNMAI